MMPPQTPTLQRVRTFFENQTTVIAYNAQNYATQIVETRPDQVRTTTLAYNASNNVSQIVEAVV